MHTLILGHCMVNRKIRFIFLVGVFDIKLYNVLHVMVIVVSVDIIYLVIGSYVFKISCFMNIFTLLSI